MAICCCVVIMAKQAVEAVQSTAQSSDKDVSGTDKPQPAAVGVALSPKPNLISQLLFLFMAPIVR